MARKLNKKHPIPFLILLVLHSCLLIFTFYKNKDRKRLTITLLSGMGLCFIFEYFVLSLFNAYRYKPKLFVNKDLDNFMGAILSQAIFVPFTVIFLTAFKIGWRGKAFFALFFAVIEKLFLRMGVHQNNWWKTRFTITLIPIFFYINDFWYQQLRIGTPIFQFGSLFLSILVNGLNLMYSMSILRKFRFGLGRWHRWKEHFMVAPIYSFTLSMTTALLIKKDSHAKGIISAFAFTKIMDMLVMRTGVAKQNFRHFLINNSIHLLMIFWAVLVKKWIYQDLNCKELDKGEECEKAGI
ncbi:hypothetical protein [Mesobacillus subterraneus]|uniref:Uncharacterized protein n=1 Tax=Mesobacillus subterraneus TaxID=285983 RepID=A0A3R9DR56_9BACI|nr:hypothetical protein [Mesobacillus subterraneus]RSD25380.1 hypothetical protein EJA10_16335 [Mesobacillus subterraneus]